MQTHETFTAWTAHVWLFLHPAWRHGHAAPGGGARALSHSSLQNELWSRAWQLQAWWPQFLG